MPMRLSNLQKYILLLGYWERGKFSRNGIIKYYEKQKRKPKIDDQVNIITKS